MITVDFHELKLKPGSLVLDAGCGSGRHLRALAKLPNLEIIGIDRNQHEEALKEMMRILKSQGSLVIDV